jgi:hypothetical protein
MSVQTPNASRFSVLKPAGIYLMELRQHVADARTRRQKLAVMSWTQPESEAVPIRYALPARSSERP